MRRSYTFAEVLGVRWWCVCLTVIVLINTTACSWRTDASVTTGVVLIDPGHGGFDGGTSAEDGTIEKHLNLAVALFLRDMLYVCGVPVAMTRDTDTGLEDSSAVSIREKKVSDMRRRLSMYNDAKLVISIHQNYFSVPKYSGTQLFYSANCAEGAVLAEAIRQKVVEWIQPQNTRELKKAGDGIYLLRHTESPAVLVECGFLSHPEEREKLKMPAYQQQLAFAVMAGYWNYQTRT